MALLNDKTMPPSQLLTSIVLKTSRFLEFKSRLAQNLGYSVNYFRLWALNKRHEGETIRLNKAIPESDADLSESESNVRNVVTLITQIEFVGLGTIYDSNGRRKPRDGLEN
jgi:hypothetical protein